MPTPTQVQVAVVARSPRSARHSQGQRATTCAQPSRPKVTATRPLRRQTYTAVSLTLSLDPIDRKRASKVV